MTKNNKFRTDVFKLTEDNWCASYRLDTKGLLKPNLVKVSVFPLGPDFKIWRVCCWGNDDMGMELDFDNKEEAKRMFDRVISWEYVNVDKLNELGFTNA